MALISGFRKHLNLKSMLQRAQSRFDKIKSPVQPREFTLTNYLMSALALFKLKYESLLKFDQDTRQNDTIRANMEQLFGVLKVSYDTAMRKVLDLLDPAQLRPVFKALLAFVCYATITMRHLGTRRKVLSIGRKGHYAGRSWDNQAERVRVDLLEVKGRDEHPAKGCDGTRLDSHRDATSGLLGYGR